jgi:hypothetical protein
VFVADRGKRERSIRSAVVPPWTSARRCAEIESERAGDAVPPRSSPGRHGNFRLLRKRTIASPANEIAKDPFSERPHCTPNIAFCDDGMPAKRAMIYFIRARVSVVGLPQCRGCESFCGDGRDLAAVHRVGFLRGRLTLSAPGTK